MSKARLNKRYLLMVRWGVPCAVVVVAASCLIVLGNTRDDPAAPNPDGSIEGLTNILSREVSADMVRFHFMDVTAEAGIDFRHFPATRQSLLPEDMGSGVAWGDYDNDGDPDLFLVNFHGSIQQEIPKDTLQGRCALYRNDGNGRFTDVSRQARVDRACFGLGAAWGDYDNDGDLDLYITCFGANVLYRNNGDGTFVEVTQPAGVGDNRFSAGCAWADYDNDGWIDLYVCNYVQFEYRGEDQARSARQYGSEIPYTINPSSYPPQSNSLFRNNGDGTFTDVANIAGVANAAGRSLGAAWFDFDNDGLVDLYVANDISSNGVYHNMGDGTFADIGASSLAADYRGAMGLAVGDYENDGDLDLFVTHWIAQENALFENMASEGWTDEDGNARLSFMDFADTLGLGQISLKMVGWSTGFADFDNDGALDLWVVNGNTLEVPEDHTRLKRQQVHLFRQQPHEGFFEMAKQACPRLAEPIVGRGGAHADYDGDGKVDLAIMVHGGQPILLHNVSSDAGHWVTLRLRQVGGNTFALGARVELRTGDRVQYAQLGAGGSYLSQHHTDLHFGLGEARLVDELTIHWPDGVTETHRNLAVDRLISITHTPTYPRNGS